ncbi:hypothetical protein D3C73_1284370 [compost metagenome]
MESNNLDIRLIIISNMITTPAIFVNVEISSLPDDFSTFSIIIIKIPAAAILNSMLMSNIIPS